MVQGGVEDSAVLSENDVFLAGSNIAEAGAIRSTSEEYVIPGAKASDMGDSICTDESIILESKDDEKVSVLSDKDGHFEMQQIMLQQTQTSTKVDNIESSMVQLQSLMSQQQQTMQQQQQALTKALESSIESGLGKLFSRALLLQLVFIIPLVCFVVYYGIEQRETVTVLQQELMELRQNLAQEHETIIILQQELKDLRQYGGELKMAQSQSDDDVQFLKKQVIAAMFIMLVIVVSLFCTLPKATHVHGTNTATTRTRSCRAPPTC